MRSYQGRISGPLLDRIDRESAQAKIDQGALWLDLRSSEQYDRSHLPGAINFPFESLRYQASSLAPDRHYVLYSNTGGRAMAGAFLLTERGFDVSVLDGGVRDETIAEVAEAANPAASAPHTSPAEDEAIQQRMREAEARAAALEAELEVARRDQESVDAERQHHLQQVRVAVDQARRKLLETEQHYLIGSPEGESLARIPYSPPVESPLRVNHDATLDEDGVGKLMDLAVGEARKTRPKIETGVCGEHGGDPASIALCDRLGLDYVSCSPFRVPVARLAAAQAALRSDSEA